MKTECPHCGQHYEVDQEYVDQIVECISCHQEFVVEVLSEQPNDTVQQNNQQSAIQEQNVINPTSQDDNYYNSATIESSSPASGLKALTCEMCGSTDMIKQNGVFVCQSCGTKYSLEEAKKMMISGTVNVAGTVTVDNTAFVKKYLENARRALEKTDWDEVEKYYNMVEQNDPRNIEAIFYSAYGKAMLSLTEEDRFKRKQKFDVFCKSESVIDDYYDASKSEYLKPIIQKMSQNLFAMFESNFVYHPHDDTPIDSSGYPTYITFPSFFHSGDAPYTEAMFAMSEVQFIESIENIIKKDEQAYLYKILIMHYDYCLVSKRLTADIKDRIASKRQKAAERLTQLDPNVKISQAPSTGGCYIATAVYGSYDCPEVWTLRRFRDFSLGASWYGRVFIKLYYRISPTIVKYFGQTEFFQTFWRMKLDKFVKELNNKGVSSKPYVDKNW